MSESLRAYRDRVASDLDEARRAAREAAERAERVGALERELAETEGLLAQLNGKRRALPLLEEVRIAAPCTASWDEMVGDDHVRFCGQCEKNVYNLSSLPREEAEALLAAREGHVCVRLYRRQDGTVLTADCPAGVRRRRRRRAAFGAVGAGVMAAAGVLGLSAGPPSVATGSAQPITTGSVQPVASVPGTTVVQGGVAPAEPQTTHPGPGHWTAGAPLMGKPALRPRTGK